jgi:DNA-directed RNA polymerase specialized sigma24 family protein
LAGAIDRSAGVDAYERTATKGMTDSVGDGAQHIAARTITSPPRRARPRKPRDRPFASRPAGYDQAEERAGARGTFEHDMGTTTGTPLDRVAERQRAVARARHYREAEGLSIAQIAQRLGRAPATVKGISTIRAARRRGR